MLIQWYGLGAVKLSAKNAGLEGSLVIDPFAPTAGAKLPRNLEASAVALTSADGDAAEVKGDPFRIEGPGEYEVKGIACYGIALNGHTIYRIEAEGMKIAYLGALAKPLDDSALEHLENVDILFVPVGGNGVLTAEQAGEVVNAIEPRVVIPIHFKTPGANAKLDGVERFAKELGANGAAPEDKFKITRPELPTEDLKLVVLNPA